MPPVLVLLDVNETLTDMSPARDAFVDVGVPAEVFDAWFAGTLRDGFGLAAAGAYADFGDLARAQLESLLTGRVGDVGAVTQRILGTLPRLDLLPDVADGLRSLAAGGVRLATLTNGSADMSKGAFERAGVLDLLEARLSVAEPRVWKPAAGAYDWAVRSLGTAPAEAALVATHPWDVDGALRAGLIGGFLDRRGDPYPSWAQSPDVTGRTLTEVADALLAL